MTGTERVRRVLVTRPEPGAARTASKLGELGFQPVVMPLTRIKPLSIERWPDPEQFDAVAVTSANAVRHAPASLLQGLAHLPVHAVGKRTGAAAERAGLSVASFEAGDAAGLLRNLIREVEAGARVLLLCGRVRRETLETGLEVQGMKVQPVETYDTLPVSPPDPDIKALQGGGQIDAVLLYSVMAAEVFSRVMARAPDAFGEAVFVAMSGRVACMVPECVRGRARVAPEPTEDSMLSVLQGATPGSAFFQP